MNKAFAKWAPYGRLKFVRIFKPSADIIVGFGSGYHGDRQPFDGPGNTLAHAYYPYELDAYGGDIHFDNDENWQTPMTKKAKQYSEGKSLNGGLIFWNTLPKHKTVVRQSYMQPR